MLEVSDDSSKMKQVRKEFLNAKSKK